jgi:hypothetical protein
MTISPRNAVTVWVEDGGSMFLRNVGTIAPGYTQCFVAISPRNAVTVWVEDGSSMFLRNVGTIAPDYTASQ